MAHEGVVWDDKDPVEVLDYELTWANRLAEGEVIETVVHTMDGGLVLESEDHTDNTTTVKVSGGTLGKTAAVEVTVTTNQGRIMRKTACLNIHKQ
jgi:hypothetical protein